MAFPFSYRGIFKYCGKEVPDETWFQDQFITRARKRFEDVMVDVELSEKGLTFRPTLRTFFCWFNRDAGCLVQISKGTIYFDSIDRKIHYVLGFKKYVIIYGIPIICIFGPFFIFIVNGPLLVRVSILLFIWFAFISAIAVGGILGFKRFLDRLSQDL